MSNLAVSGVEKGKRQPSSVHHPIKLTGQVKYTPYARSASIALIVSFTFLLLLHILDGGV